MPKLHKTVYPAGVGDDEDADVLILTRSEIAGLLDMDQVIAAVEHAHASLASGSASDLGPASLGVPASSTLMIPMVAAIANGAGGMKLLMDTPDNAACLALPNNRRSSSSTPPPDPVMPSSTVQLSPRSEPPPPPPLRPDTSPEKSQLSWASSEPVRSPGPISRRWDQCALSVTSSSGAGHRVPPRRSRNTPPTKASTPVSSPHPRKSSQPRISFAPLPAPASPVVQGRWFKPGLHVNAVGAPPRGDHREIDTEGIKRSRVVVDSLPVARQKSGDVLIPLAEGAIDERHFQDELGQIITGNRPRRTDAEQITLYDSVGVAIQDIVTAQCVSEPLGRKESERR